MATTDRLKVHKTSARTGDGKDNWRTPRSLFERLDAEFGFDLDAAADASNALCNHWLGPGHSSESYNDALTALWRNPNHRPGPQTAWCNPPYSMLRKFVAKAAAEMSHDVTSVFLIPARTDTHAFRSIFEHAAEIRFVIGRLAFLDEKGEPMRDKKGRAVGAPFPSAIVVFRPGHAGGPKVTTMTAKEP